MAKYKVLQNIYLAKDDKNLLVGDIVDFETARVDSINEELGNIAFESLESKSKRKNRTKKKEVKEVAD